MGEPTRRSVTAAFGIVSGAVVIAMLAMSGLPRVLAAATAAGDATPDAVPPRATPIGAMTVIGAIVVPATTPAGPPATVYVRIEDVSRADAPATVLASLTIDDVALPPGGGQIPFSIPVDRWEDRARYSVRVHIDRDGDGTVSRGDLVSTQVHPVPTDDGDPIAVPVSPV